METIVLFRPPSTEVKPCVSRAGFGLPVVTGNIFLIPALSVLLSSFLENMKIRLVSESRLHELHRWWGDQTRGFSNFTHSKGWLRNFR